MRPARRAAWLVCTVACLAAGHAGAADWLSGAYRPAQAELDQARAPPAQLLVAASGDGWLARFDGRDRTLEPVSAATLADLFPGLGADAQLQCGRSAGMMLCHVRPGTSLEREGFVSGSGYFSVIADAGLFELEKLDE